MANEQVAPAEEGDVLADLGLTGGLEPEGSGYYTNSYRHCMTVWETVDTIRGNPEMCPMCNQMVVPCETTELELND